MAASTSGASFLLLFLPSARANRRRRRINNKLVLTSSSVYYRNAVLSGGNVNGTAPPPMNLIDYDAIPDDVAIPNGGFKQYPPVVSTSTISLPTGGFSTSLVSKIIITPTPTTTRRGIMSYENAEARKRSEAVEPTPIFRAARKVVDLIPTKREDMLAKRAVTTVLPIGFKGMMIGTSFPSFVMRTGADHSFLRRHLLWRIVGRLCDAGDDARVVQPVCVED